MVEQNDERLTRRQFVKWSFGILAIAVTASTQSFLLRLQKIEPETSSSKDDAEAKSAYLTATQYLQSRPELSAEFSLRDDGDRKVLEGRDATFLVNESAYFALSRCDGNTTVRGLCEAMVAHFDVSFDRVANDLVDLVNCLYRLDVMTFSLTYRLDRQYVTQPHGKSTWTTIAI
jgi:hypothetical protein